VSDRRLILMGRMHIASGFSSGHLHTNALEGIVDGHHSCTHYYLSLVHPLSISILLHTLNINNVHSTHSEGAKVDENAILIRSILIY
jgi:hypothetical protein